MRALFRLALWNIGFGVGLIALVFIFAVWVEYYFPSIGRSVADAIALGLPGILALWVLFLGSLYATSRASVVACAAGAGLLVLVQGALLGLLLLWSKGFGGRTSLTTAFELLLAVVMIIGVGFIWSFVSAKRASRGTRA